MVQFEPRCNWTEKCQCPNAWDQGDAIPTAIFNRLSKWYVSSARTTKGIKKVQQCDGFVWVFTLLDGGSPLALYPFPYTYGAPIYIYIHTSIHKYVSVYIYTTSTANGERKLSANAVPCTCLAFELVLIMRSIHGFLLLHTPSSFIFVRAKNIHNVTQTILHKDCWGGEVSRGDGSPSR